MLDHAETSGAHTFQGVKVESIQFTPAPDFPEDTSIINLGRAASAIWSRKADGATGSIKFDYLVDASGRNGIMSTRYLKNRKFNTALKNVAYWGYWKGAKSYAPGTKQEGFPLFEALTDQSGWCWAIPLHNETMSIGIVMNQDRSVARKRAMESPTPLEFYKACIALSPNILSRLADAELVSPTIQTGSDWSYSASAYAGPNFRLVGDAGCFIDPYFSSGLHLALASGLSAAMTIQASRRGECSELQAAKWHSWKVAESYSRFLLVVMTAMRQIRAGEQPVLSDFDEDGFDRAMGFFRPSQSTPSSRIIHSPQLTINFPGIPTTVIQGLADADVGGKLTQDSVSKSVDFCLHAFKGNIPREAREAVLEKLDRIKADADRVETSEDLEQLNEDELAILRTVRARQMLRTEDCINIDYFAQNVIDGFVPRLVRGDLGLAKLLSRTAGPAYTEGLLDGSFRDESVTSTNSKLGPEGAVRMGETEA